MKLVQYHSPQGVVLALFVTEGPKYIKLLTMASTPRITKVHRGEARRIIDVPATHLNNVERFLNFTRNRHNGSMLADEVYEILYNRTIFK